MKITAIEITGIEHLLTFFVRMYLNILGVQVSALFSHIGCSLLK